MARKRKVRPSDLLGPTEAQVMAVLWKQPGIGGMEAARLLNEGRGAPVSFRTVLTILARLEAKGYVHHTVEGRRGRTEPDATSQSRSFRYSAAVPEDEFVQWHADRALKELLQRYGDDVTIAGLVNASDRSLLERLDELLDRE
jgi:predicted transcriptional regulator